MPEPRDNADSTVRDHLIAEAVDFRTLMSSTLKGHKIENGETVWDHLSHRVDALLEGKAITFHRYELPDGHPMEAPHGGRPNDLLEIGEDDVVRPYESAEPQFAPPNRKQRRELQRRMRHLG
jgi:hypothetical protein